MCHPHIARFYLANVIWQAFLSPRSHFRYRSCVLLIIASLAPRDIYYLVKREALGSENVFITLHYNISHERCIKKAPHNPDAQPPIKFGRTLHCTFPLPLVRSWGLRPLQPSHWWHVVKGDGSTGPWECNLMEMECLCNFKFHRSHTKK